MELAGLLMLSIFPQRLLTWLSELEKTLEDLKDRLESIKVKKNDAFKRSRERGECESLRCEYQFIVLMAILASATKHNAKMEHSTLLTEFKKTEERIKETQKALKVAKGASTTVPSKRQLANDLPSGHSAKKARAVSL